MFKEKLKKLNYQLLTAIVIIIATKIDVALACASCGSSGDDPLVMFPNESAKMLLSFSQVSGFRNIDSRGQESAAGGPDSKQSLGLSAGKAISHRSFVTLTGSVLKNVKGDQEKNSLGDPSLSGRYTLVMLSLDEIYTPQVQLSYGYKHQIAKGIRDSKERFLLDVGGTGFSDLRAGVDVWYGLWSIKPGIAFSVVNPIAKEIHGKTYDPGLIYRSTTSVSYLTDQNFKLGLGTNREYKTSIAIKNGISTEAQLTNAWFASAELIQGSGSSVKFSLLNQGRIFENYNTARSISLTGSFIKVL